ncbi:OmpH family outer membrane protein [Chitinophaga oryzae]|uniref:OmpH family outer membrane protein n=1 Tax=Chitinophaga oryzae TaxID=2725414 RepID=A0AAE7D980_9BACT|nr:OmpH family outer membrane protein [Chitinophaga oryzae]QJB34143.1 OmpH family outer membrane protein [Chitinophaga oryzae]QJB40663.1 OmpH family outer membrane protein [Chitinophaga oryzae]
MKKFVIIAFVAVTGLFSVNAMAQSKVAHINAQALVGSMPEAKKAETDLQTYAQSLEAEGKTMVDEYTKKVKEFDEKAASMTDNMKEIKGREIQDAQKRIQDYRERAESQVQQKQQELLKPIYDKARKAIEDVAKEKGYGYVIDSSAGLLLVSPSADDLLPAVKAKLGIK